MILTVIDTETTGLSCDKHEIIQLGVIVAEVSDNGRIKTCTKKEVNVRPTKIDSASKESLKINGYTADGWSNSVGFEEVYPFLDMSLSVCDAMLGQNLFFDLNFIYKEYKQRGIQIPLFPPYYDTKAMGQELKDRGSLKGTSLDYMCRFFNIHVKGRSHTALADCERTLVLWDLLNKYTTPKLYSFEQPFIPIKML